MDTKTRLGFTLWVQPQPRCTPQDAQRFDQRLQDYLADNRLLTMGEPECRVVWSAERSLTTADQVELIDWVAGDMVPLTLRFSPLGEVVHKPVTKCSAGFQVDGTDMTLIPLTWLFRCQRISADMFLQILGGSVRPTVVH